MSTEPLSNEFLEEVKSFIAEHTCVKITRLCLETTLREDLGIDGDDAVDLLEAFSREFQIDLSDLNFTEYFDAEGFNLFSLFSSRRKKLKPLTVGKLVDTATSGRWQSDEV